MASGAEPTPGVQTPSAPLAAPGGLLKPPRFTAPAAATALIAALALGGFWGWQSGLFDGGAARAEAARAAALQAARAQQMQHLAFTQAYDGQEAQEIRVGQGETLARILTRAGASPGEASAAMNAASGVFNPRTIRPGLPINVYFRRADSEQMELTGFSFRSQPGATVTVNRISSGGYNAREVLMPTSFENARINSTVEGSLHAAATRLGATPGIIEQMADVFAYDVDFQRDVRPGDPFELVYERRFDEDGNTVSTGDLLFVSLTTRGRERVFYRFRATEDREPQWYDPEGKSARRFLMKTPVNGARLSSGFGVRRHPILGFNRAHRGTDFAAPTGTPIMAAGEGVVQRAGRFGGYGNYIRIRHSTQYDTAYGHMSRFARGVRAGTRVRQGQIIGYVGSTGASTGPHLHYEVFQNGRQINPMTLRAATGRNLTGMDLQLFQAERTRIDRLREVRDAQDAGVDAPATTNAALSGAGGPGALR